MTNNLGKVMQHGLIMFVTLIGISCRTALHPIFTQNIPGYYISISSKFEKTSELTLNTDSGFVYFYALGGCQDMIKGRWWIEKNHVKLAMQIIGDSVLYRRPNLDKINWTIRRNGLKPSGEIDNFCFSENSLHIKMTVKNPVNSQYR